MSKLQKRMKALYAPSHKKYIPPKPKVYFTKYLPVEGEIKEGDKILSNMDGVVTADRKQDGYWKTKEGVNVSSYPNGGGKVKLFLCSRDIQVGDKVQFQLVMNKTPWKELEVIDVDGLNLQLKDGDFIIHTTIDNTYTVFKVIGEVSPEAVWVEEEDEFDEDQVLITEQCPHYGGKHMFKDCSCKTGFVFIAQIKCSQYNTFH